MRIIDEPGDVTATLRAERAAGRSVGLVPTLGALHQGHASLVAAARAAHDVVVLSVFVNPLQFDRADDLARYPRDLEADAAFAAAAGVDVCFAPSAHQMYPGGEPVVRVDPGRLGGVFEGASRPGHFSGVATVVTKLLALTAPDAAYFGEKDYQQLVIVRRLTADLSMPIEIVGCPTVREPDGLAVSSRNRRLSPRERSAAAVLHRALVEGRDAAAGGAARAEVESAMAKVVGSEPLATLDYVAVTDPVLEIPGDPLSGRLRLLVAAEVGPVRLIDNVEASA
ncbi:MAG: pantoate--beta-alanine ligase [Acidimicrobiaceae bacterium]|jgi:pantoate--beta-alanine ligase|nr:pantoate--beta-alanine ligase [Acidimicrobiaceae bacterium]